MTAQRKPVERWWSQYDVARITQRRHEGWTRREIAEELGMSIESLRVIIQAEGITRPRASYVMSRRRQGGVITPNIGPELHRRLAEMCFDNRESMNKCVTRLIRAAVDRHEEQRDR